MIKLIATDIDGTLVRVYIEIYPILEALRGRMRVIISVSQVEDNIIVFAICLRKYRTGLSGRKWCTYSFREKDILVQNMKQEWWKDYEALRP